jgi:DNA-binding MarR family transcriptional regulator
VKSTVAMLAGVFEMHIRLEKIVKSFDLALSAGEEPMTYLDFRALGCVLCFGPISLKHSSDTLEVPKTTVHYVLGKLEARGLIQRAPARRKGSPVFTATEAGREAWGRGVQTLLQGPFGGVFGEQPAESVENALERARSLWVRSGAGAQNPSIRHEALVLAVTAAEYLIQRAARTVDGPLLKSARAERRSFLS